MSRGAGIRTIGEVREANDVLRFLLELCTLAAVAYWGWAEGGAWPSVGVVTSPDGFGTFMAPKSTRRVADPWRLALELVIFGSAVVALAWAGQMVLAIVFAAAAAVHLALTFVLGQRDINPPV